MREDRLSNFCQRLSSIICLIVMLCYASVSLIKLMQFSVDLHQFNYPFLRVIETGGFSFVELENHNNRNVGKRQ